MMRNPRLHEYDDFNNVAARARNSAPFQNDSNGEKSGVIDSDLETEIVGPPGIQSGEAHTLS